MNFFDVIVIIILALGLIRGLFRGFVKEVASIAGVIAGFYGATAYHGVAARQLLWWIDTPVYRNLLAFLILFALIVVLVGLTANLIRYFMRIAFLGWVDRFCGLVFGSAKAVLVCVVLFVVLTTFLPSRTDVLSGSKSAPYLAEISQWASVFVTPEIQKKLQVKIKGLKEYWKQQQQKMPVKTGTQT